VISRRARILALAGLVPSVALLACASGPLRRTPSGRRPAPAPERQVPPGEAVVPVRLTSVASAGDAARRASTRLALEGLDADASAQPALAADRYARALQVDPTNPWVYLALARHRLDEARPADALAALDQAESRLRAEGALAPGVEIDVIGLRGWALVASGNADRGASLLRDAAQSAPGVWGDGRLDASELR
jgi:hypothetical protein